VLLRQCIALISEAANLWPVAASEEFASGENGDNAVRWLSEL
jgi:hypothetical protein